MAPAARIVPAAVLVGLAIAGCAGSQRPDRQLGPAQPNLTLSPIASTPVRPVSSTSAPADKPGGPAPTLPTAYKNELILGTTAADHPVGWTRTEVGAPPTAADHSADRVDYRDPTGQLLLRFGFLEDPRQPSVALRDLVARTSGNYPGYQLISLHSGQDSDADRMRVYAEWTFRFVKDGITRMVIIRVIGGRGLPDSPVRSVDYLYFSAPAAYFDRTRAVYDRAAYSLNFDL